MMKFGAHDEGTVATALKSRSFVPCSCLGPTVCAMRTADDS